MNFILKNLNEKNLLFLISLFLIIFAFINFTHKHFEIPKNKDYNSPIAVQEAALQKAELRTHVNKLLTSDSTYEEILSKKCSVTGNMHDRHKVRWVKSLLLKNIYQLSEKLNSKLPYYVNIILHSFLIFLSIIFLNQAFKLEKIYIIFFLLYVTYIFQFHLGEYSYSIFEMFFVSAAIYASKKKNIILFFLIIIMAILNRESGFIIILIWLIFNKEFKKFLIFSFIILTIFLIVNYDSINCMVNPKFFIPLEKQAGQTILNELGSINFYSRALIVTMNYILHIGLIFYNIFKSNEKNKILILIGIIYLFVFLFAVPIHQMGTKLIILPLIILSFNLSNKKMVN
jgi:hypothetical protein